MPMLASYIFKPEHGHEIATKIIERFCNDFLYYSHEGFYLNWRTGDGKWTGRQNLPEGYIEFWIETENGNMEAWTETCFNEAPLTAHDLTDGLFALLDDNFWYAEDGENMYTFYEHELAELVSSLSAKNSRVVSFDGGSAAWIHEKDSQGQSWPQRLDMLDYALTVPIVKESRPQDNQQELSL